MPENHYAVGGSMAVYSAKGRMRVYAISGSPDGNEFVPRFRVGSGSIEGVGATFAARRSGGDGGIIGAGDPAVARQSALHTGANTILVGAGSPAALGAMARTNSGGTIIGSGSLAADYTIQEGRTGTIIGAGSLAAYGTSIRIKEVTIVGNGSVVFDATSSRNFYEMILAIGAETSLDFCLDAGDIGSYDGSGQTWTDLSGNGNSYFRGSNSTAQASDPTFNGSAGEKSEAEYFSYDGADLFQETTAQTFANNWSKNNAQFTLAGVAFVPAGMGTNRLPLFSSGESTSAGNEQRMIVRFSESLGLSLSVRDGSNGAVCVPFKEFAAGLPNRMVFFAVALNEATGASGGTLQIDDSQDSFTSTYTSPDADSPAGSCKIGYSRVNTTTTEFAPSGTSVAVLAGWSRRLTDAELMDLYEELQNRFSDLP